jgi:ATP-dependent exoDNAse (exonuclease V) beta subunit
MHSNCEAYLKQEELPHTEGEGYELFNNIKPLLEPISEVWAQEIVLWSHSQQLAGRLDCLGIYDNKLTLIDFKSSRHLKKESDIFNYIMQTTLYCYMLYELFGLKVEQIAILIGLRKDKKGIRPAPQKFVFPATKYIPELFKLLKTYDRVILNLDRLKQK